MRRTSTQPEPLVCSANNVGKVPTARNNNHPETFTNLAELYAQRPQNSDICS
jgi:hypothetical protein